MNRHAFSLVELSVVLVLLGLLVGGILAGQNLIRSSEIRAVGTQFQKYMTATQTFQDEFRGLPGDLRNATSYWGDQHPTPATCQSTSSLGYANTCNGNGDRMIGVLYSTALPSTQTYERYRAWQQLASAGLIEGAFSGISSTTAGAFAGAGTSSSVPGLNTPKGKINAGGFEFNNMGVVTSIGALNPAEYNNVITFGRNVSGSPSTDPILTGEEAWRLDTKTDDGAPNNGTLMVPLTIWNNTQCTTGGYSAYNLTAAGPVCTLILITGF